MNTLFSMLSLAVSLNFIFMVILAYIQFRVYKSHSGLSWWMAGIVCGGLGFAFGSLRYSQMSQISQISQVSIIFYNVLLIVSQILIYIGFLRFMGQRERGRPLLVFLAIYTVVFIYFTFFNDQFIVRWVIVSLSGAVISFLTAWSIIKYKVPSIASTAYFLAVVFLIHAIFFTVRAGIVFTGMSTADLLMSGSLIQNATFLDVLIVAVLGTFGLITMVNQRVVAEAQEARKHFELVFNTNPDAVLITNLEDGTVYDANQGFTALAGYTKEEVVGKSSLKLNFWYNLQDRQNYTDQLRDKGYCSDFEAILLRKDGTQFYGSISARKFMVDNKSYILTDVRDATDRKRAEDLLIHAKQAAEAANQAKSVFFAMMGHEFRTPLNTILGYSQLMARDANLTAAQLDGLATINRSGEDLLQLINDVLDLAKLNAGRFTIQSKTFDLTHLLDDLCAMFQLSAKGKGIDFLLDVAPDVPHLVVTDEAKLRQILTNLLGNAVKFTPAAGTVSLQVSVQLHSVPMLTFQVKDSGVGISPTELESIFNSFAQIDSTEKLKKGVGFGLAIHREFAQVLGGELTAASEGIPGRGSVFTLTLPVQPGSEADLPQQDQRLPSPLALYLQEGQPAYRILVAEDSPENSALLCSLLTRFGFDVLGAVDGREAFDIWQVWQPHFIWMDLQMPVMDGKEAARLIRTTCQAEPSCLVPVIVALSASAFEEARSQILDAGCDDFLLKPFREEDIVAMLQKHLGVQFIYETPFPAEEEYLL